MKQGQLVQHCCSALQSYNKIPCRMRAPMPNQKLLSRVKLFCIRVEDGLQGCGLYHSYGVNLRGHGEEAKCCKTKH